MAENEFYRMKSESNISSLSFSDDETSRHFAEILLQSGQIQRPSWKGLQRYWDYAKSTEVEYMAASHSGHYAVFCFTVASGQGGIIAVWNSFRKRWEHVSEGNYIACAMMLETIPAVVSIHYISCWGVSGHHSIYATPLNRTLDGFAEIAIPITAKFSKQGFDLGHKGILKVAYGDYTNDKNGPRGIFLLEDNNTLFAHDAGNLYQFSVVTVANALSANNRKAKQNGGGQPATRPES